MKRIDISPKAISKILISITTVLIILSVTSHIVAHITGFNSMKGLIPFFDVDEELNLPTFFSGMILFVAAFLLAFIYILQRQEKDGFYWAVLSAGFFYMTFDEIFMFHERFINPVTYNLFGGYFDGIFQFSWLMWVIPFGIMVIILFFVFIKFLSRIPVKTRNAFFTAGFIYVGGAIGIELIEGYISVVVSEDSLLNNLVSTIQEGLEMYAVIIFISSMLYYILDNYKEISFKLNE